MEFKLTYTITKTFEVPDNATDEEYDAVKDTVIDALFAGSLAPESGVIKVKRIDTPPKEPEPYQINRDAVD